ncbi:hypothetical protein SLOPH_1671 [Spraguea lophii 42_110]|uniref:Uncharacterized protein n=1 Tax=Spraguea lophii (strain 42_110) TaxID=1358809 RepID=S7XTT9_SPRLO|nr:hypothetical protein SLOPH_1671 [Spraguea lophii 42_110]
MKVNLLSLRIIDKLSSKEYFLMLQKSADKYKIILGASIELHQPQKIYFESIDSTGLFTPITHQSSVTSLFIHSIINFINPTFLELFYHSKNEILFKKSSKNKNKKICKNMKKYWLRILERYNKCSESNIYEKYIFNNKEYNIPYKNIEEIIFFDDDPKRKVYDFSNKNISLKELYDILLCKHDFVEGGFITLKCKCKKHNKNTTLKENITLKCEYEKDNKDITLKENITSKGNITLKDNITTEYDENITLKESITTKYNKNIQKLIEIFHNNTLFYNNFKNLILQLNFENEEKSSESLEIIKKELKLESFNFQEFDLSKKEKHCTKENIIKINVRKKIL